MGAWADLELDVDTLKGLASSEWASKAQQDVSGEITAQAKETIEDLVAARIPDFVARKGGTEAFFDAAADKAALATSLQRMLGLAYLHADWSDHGSRPGQGAGYTNKARAIYDASGLRPSGTLVVAAKAFAGQAPVLLWQTNRPAGPAGAALASTMDRYNRGSRVTFEAN